MGWSYNTKPCAKVDHVNDLVRRLGIKHHVLAGRTLYGVQQCDAAYASYNGRGRRMVMVVLLDAGTGVTDVGCWGEKVMDESWGPDVDTCPTALFAHVDPPINDWAAAFRERCAAREARNA